MGNNKSKKQEDVRQDNTGSTGNNNTAINSLDNYRYKIKEPYFCNFCKRIYHNYSLYDMHYDFCHVFSRIDNGTYTLEKYLEHLNINRQYYEGAKFSNLKILMRQNNVIRYDPDVDKPPNNLCPYEISDGYTNRACLKKLYQDHKHCKKHHLKLEKERLPPSYEEATKEAIKEEIDEKINQEPIIINPSAPVDDNQNKTNTQNNTGISEKNLVQQLHRIE
jgi:hypothetical protein